MYIPLTDRVRGPYCKLPTKFVPLQFRAQAQSMRDINPRGKNEDQKNIYYISTVCLTVPETIVFMQTCFEFLKHLESKMSQFEIILFESSACFNYSII